MMRNRQTGMTAIGMVLVLVVLGLIGFGVIQLVPVYLENMKIQQVMKQTKANLDGQNANITDIRKALAKRANIEALYDVNPAKDFVIKRSQEGYSVTMDYARKKPYFANVSLLAEFENSVEIIR
jgi:hypothetical protein